MRRNRLADADISKKAHFQKLVNFNMRVLLTRVIYYAVNFSNHQLWAYNLCTMGLRNSAVSFQIEVAHS